MARVISTCLREERRILSSACMQEQVCHIVCLSEGKVPLLQSLLVNLGHYQEDYTVKHISHPHPPNQPVHFIPNDQCLAFYGNH